MYCSKCDSEVGSVIKEIDEIYPVKNEDIRIRAKVRFCNCCNNDLWDEELDANNLLVAFNEYRSRHNLLQPTEIRRIREKYNLSQRSFSRILGFGDKTITRYENGSIADEAQNNLMVLIAIPDNFKQLLEKNKDKIPKSDYEKALKSIREPEPRVVHFPAKESSYELVPKYNFYCKNDAIGGVCERSTKYA